MYKRIPGTKDILPDEAFQWEGIEDTSRKVFSLFNFQEIRTPLIEDAGLFNRSLGEFTEIVQKQMFILRNKDDIYALRPEGTASVVRSYLENNLHKSVGFSKFFYIGPMFRLERPQKGRLREFHHIGAEIIGSCEPLADIEILSLTNRLLKSWEIADAKLIINNLGCPTDRKALIENLKENLADKLSDFCEECKNRFKNNILRILDCKKPSCKEVLSKIKLNNKHICENCSNHFKDVTDGLDSLKIQYEIDPLLIRGLDYYTRTVFEIKHGSLGSQDALGAGGRYDNLVRELGGPQLGAIGFAFGIERIMLVAKTKFKQPESSLVYLILLGDEAKKKGLSILENIRLAGIKADTSYESKSLKGMLRKANDLGAKQVLILGDSELKNNSLVLKNMLSGTQKEISQNDLIKELQC